MSIPTAPLDTLGHAHVSQQQRSQITFEIPTRQPPLVGGEDPVGGSNRDMGSLALFLVANWYVNGETVLIDGGVSDMFPPLPSFFVLFGNVGLGDN